MNRRKDEAHKASPGVLMGAKRLLIWLAPLTFVIVVLWLAGHRALDIGTLPLVLLLVASITAGTLLLVPRTDHRAFSSLNRPSSVATDLGTALVAGAVISLAILSLGLRAEEHAAEGDRHRLAAERRQDLLLTLGIEDDLAGIDLRHRDLRGVILREKNLYGARLSGADLTGADLTGSNLAAANLRGAELQNARLQNVVWSTTTIWPAEVKKAIRQMSLFIDLSRSRDARLRERYRRFLTVLERELEGGQSLFAVSADEFEECGWAPDRPTFRYAGGKARERPISRT